MNLATLIADTHALQRRLYSVDQLTTPQREQWTKEYVLQLHTELSEVLTEVNWKHHKLDRKEVDREKLLLELVDCQKFLVGLFYVWGFQADEIEQAWKAKTAIVQRSLDSQFTKRNFPLTSPFADLFGVAEKDRALEQLKFQLSEAKSDLEEAERNLQVIQGQLVNLQ